MTVEEAEVDMRDAFLVKMPGWRRPLRVSPTKFELAAESSRERVSLRQAIFDLASCHTPMSADALRAAVREDWGSASDAAIDRERDELVRDGDLARVPGGWVRIERDDDMEDV